MLCMLYSQHFLLRTIGLLALQQLSSSEFNDISLGAGEEIELEISGVFKLCCVSPSAVEQQPCLQTCKSQ